MLQALLLDQVNSLVLFNNCFKYYMGEEKNTFQLKGKGFNLALTLYSLTFSHTTRKGVRFIRIVLEKGLVLR